MAGIRVGQSLRSGKMGAPNRTTVALCRWYNTWPLILRQTLASRLPISNGSLQEIGSTPGV
ncbi:MAG: hypothetical protein B7Z55_18220 [Planctomycetales bacterium 12-60-4]|nr:MAG: hypothetical protein B7Z55_18220 [Planctomycetales bacterium 12-60-4]